MDSLETTVKALVADVCKDQNVYLLQVDIKGSGRVRQVRVTADTEQGITLNQCQQLSNEINDIFYRKDIYADGYNLEVSSPGVDKPLEHDFEFRRNVGRDLSVEYLSEDIVKKITGTLVKYSGSELHLKLGKDVQVIHKDQVQRAKVKLKW